MTPLIGRAEELRRIGGRLEGARRSAGGCLVVSGEAGIGKTALLAASAEAAEGFSVLQTRGVESDAELPFTGMVELVRPIVPLLSRLPERQALALEVALAIRCGTAADQLTLGAAMLNLLTLAAESRPLLVLVDDAQWVDASSAEVFVFAAHRLSADAVLVLVAQRSDEPSVFDDTGLEHLIVPRLDAHEAAELAVRAAGRPLPQEQLRQLYDATAGNPLGLVELAGAPLPPACGQLVPALTSRLERAFVGRFAQLSDEAVTAAVVAAASTSGDSRMIHAALATQGLGQAALSELEHAGLLMLSGAQIAFRHPLVRSAVYGWVTPVARREAHRALAVALRDDADFLATDERAWHLATAAYGPDENAASALDAAADRARRRGSLPAAAAAFRRGAELSVTGTARARRLIAAAETSLLMGQHQDALALISSVAGTADEPELAARAKRLRTQIDLLRKSPLQVHDQLVLAADTLEHTDPEEAMSLLATAAGAAAMSGNARLAHSTAERAHRTSQNYPAPLRTTTKVLLAHSLLLVGQAAAGDRLLREAMGMLDGIDPLALGTEVYAFLAMDLMWMEDWRACWRVLEAAVGRARAASAPERLVNLLAVYAELELRTGHWDAAMAIATESADLARDLRQPITAAYALTTSARVAAHQGAMQVCREHLSRGRELLAGLGAGLVDPYIDLAAAQERQAAGDAAAAAAYLRDLDAKVTAAGMRNPAVLQYHADLIDACWRANLNPQASDVLLSFRALLRDAPSAKGSADLARCDALLDPGDGQYAEAEARANAQADPFTRARTQLDHGEWLRRERRRSEARTVLTQAADTFASLRATPWVHRAERELQAVGGTQPDRPRTSVELTPQELQVARLVAKGATNREAAQALYLSVKTIEYHLRHIYDKLCVRSRVELAVRLPQLSPEPVSAGGDR